MDEKTFKEKLKLKFPEENYSIIYAGKNSSEKSTLKCLDCGRRIIVNTGELFRARRKYICTKCHYKRKDTQRNEEIIRERLKDCATDINFYMQNRNGIRHNMVNFTCKYCGRINTKEVANFLREKYNCNYCEGRKEGKDTDSFLKELREKHGNKFTLLTEYINVKTPIKIKCNNCGFIREVKPSAILASGFCPKCEKRDSIGEKKISQYLDKNNISFIPQMYFSNWGIGLHYFDFYIPNFNLVLEFHGIQHYEFNDFFHKDLEDFKYRSHKDLLKKEAALKNGLNYASINYSLINDLDTILNYIFNSTTIPSGSKGKCLEIETIQDIG